MKRGTDWHTFEQKNKQTNIQTDQVRRQWLDILKFIYIEEFTHLVAVDQRLVAITTDISILLLYIIRINLLISIIIIIVIIVECQDEFVFNRCWHRRAPIEALRLVARHMTALAPIDAPCIVELLDDPRADHRGRRYVAAVTRRDVVSRVDNGREFAQDLRKETSKYQSADGKVFSNCKVKSQDGQYSGGKASGVWRQNFEENELSAARNDESQIVLLHYEPYGVYCKEMLWENAILPLQIKLKEAPVASTCSPYCDCDVIEHNKCLANVGYWKLPPT